MGRRKYLTELIIEGKQPEIVNKQLSEPYLFLVDDELERLQKAINILATTKGYRVVSQSLNVSWGNVLVLMEKKEKQQ